MCGINGIYAYKDCAEPVDRAELRAVRDNMRTRGPDGHGEWHGPDGRVGFGHRRLAIIDLSDRAAQPMQTADGRFTVTFNGEIYNYASLRSELERKGYVFRTTSDTEVLLHLFAERGPAMLNDLRGMYAFGIWDAIKRVLLLARDPYGIKPLYYSDNGETLRFASQVRALLAGGAISRQSDTAGRVGFFLWGSVPEPYTSYRSIRALPAGAFLVVSPKGVQPIQQHSSIAQIWAEASESATYRHTNEDAQTLIREALLDSVGAHMIADVPVSAFLSGGIDSGALVGLMAEHTGRSAHAITLSFAEFSGSNDDEVPLATTVANYYGVHHHVRRVQQDEFCEDLPAIFANMDQPSIDGVNTWFVSKATAEIGLKVAISGLGGDELFGGYSTFQQLPKLARMTHWPSRIPGLGRAVRRTCTSALSRVAQHAHPKLAGVLEYGGSLSATYFLKRGLFMPWELDALLPRDVVRDGLERLSLSDGLETLVSPVTRNAWAQVAVLEACQYMRNQLLRDTDWASMAHSLEVRVPLVDYQLLSRVASVIAASRPAEGKRWLAASPKRSLPSQVRNRSKTGFSTPVQRWLSNTKELDNWRRVPALARDGCPWARRFAYVVSQLAS